MENGIISTRRIPDVSSTAKALQIAGGANIDDGLVADEIDIIATLEELSNRIDALIPSVGDIYITTNNTNPSNKFPGTKWSLFGPGKTIVCVDTSQTEFNSSGKTGGEKTHKLTTSEIPSHYHNGLSIDGNAITWNQGFSTGGSAWSFGTGGNANTIRSGSSGGGTSHNNLQPYITCYIWKRTK